MYMRREVYRYLCLHVPTSIGIHRCMSTGAECCMYAKAPCEVFSLWWVSLHLSSYLQQDRHPTLQSFCLSLCFSFLCLTSTTSSLPLTLHHTKLKTARWPRLLLLRLFLLLSPLPLPSPFATTAPSIQFHLCMHLSSIYVTTTLLSSSHASTDSFLVLLPPSLLCSLLLCSWSSSSSLSSSLQLRCPDIQEESEAKTRSKLIESIDYTLLIHLVGTSTYIPPPLSSSTSDVPAMSGMTSGRSVYAGEMLIEFSLKKESASTALAKGISLNFSGGVIQGLWVNGKHVAADGLALQSPGISRKRRLSGSFFLLLSSSQFSTCVAFGVYRNVLGWRATR